MKRTTFEWDEEKDKENQAKHGISFLTAQQAFLDPLRVIVLKKIGFTAWGVSTKAF
jgi:uncharacterized DUF497 family protein